MSPINSYKDNPLYPDRYVEGSNWVRVLPIPGRALQTSELMEMQSILQGQVRMALSSLYRDGSPINGLRVIGQGPTYTVTSGLFYVQGMAIPVEAVASFTPGISNTVYVVVDESILTETNTPSLRDPIREAGYGLEGAHRLVWTATISNTAGPSSYPIATIGLDGQIIQRATTNAPHNSCLDLLAAYTRDRMGDFLLEGLLVTYGGARQVVSTPLSTYKKGEVDRLSNELLEYNTLVTNSGTELSRVRLELEAAIVLATQSPSAPNRFVVDTKRRRVQELEVVMGTLSSEVNALTAQLSSMSLTVPLREVLNVSPGVVYIDGYRLEKVTGTTVEVPRSNAVEEVEAAKFTYLSSPATTIRTLLPSGLFTDGGSITMAFTGIPYLAGYISVTATYSWTDSIRPLYDLVEAFQKGLCTYISNASLAPSTLKEALRRVVSMALSGANTLLITSQYRDSLLGLTITSNRYEVDVEEAYLTAPTLYLNSYELGRKPVADINRVVADLEGTLLPITKSGDRDSLGDDTVFSIKEVRQGTQIYVEGRDYTLYGQGWIEWRPQVGPAQGTTYYVTYLYTQPLNSASDYKLIGNNVVLTNSTRKPASGSTFTVDYTYSLPQMGRIFIDRNAVIGYSLSPPSIDPVPPQASSGTLSLAIFTLVRGNVLITELATRRLSVADLSTLLKQYKQREVLNALPVAVLPPTNNVIISNVSTTPSYVTTPTRYLNVAIKYLGGGQSHDGHHLSLPYSTRPYLVQGRVTNVHSLAPRTTPHIYIHPQVVTQTTGTDYTIHPCSNIKGQVDWAVVEPRSNPTASTTLKVIAMGLDDNEVYMILYAGRPNPYTVVVGRNTSAGVKSIKGKVEIYLSITNTPPGSYRVEMKPLSPNSLPAINSLTVVHPLYRQLGMDKNPLPNALGSATLLPPISQTIVVPEDIYLSAISLSLRYIDPGTTLWVTVETMDTIPKIIGMGMLGVASVSSKGGERTQIPLDYPVYLREGMGYRLCVYVHGGEVDIYTATLGQVDLNDGTRIGGQLLHLGEVTISEDGTNGMVLPQEDLTHTLHAAYYLTHPVVASLGTYGLPDLLTPVTAFCINGVDILPPGTSILYEYKSDSIWRPCTRGVITCTTPSSSITIRATMYTSKASLTPLLTLEGVTVSIYSNAEAGVLKGEGIGPHTRVRLSFIKNGAEGSVIPSISILEGVWLPMTLLTTSPLGDEIRYTYEATLGPVQHSEYSIALWDRPYIREVSYELYA
jgi:hypothetical protein